MAFSSDPVTRFNEITALFTERVSGTDNWDADAPVDGWVARDVVDHLVTWIREFLASGGVELEALSAHAPSETWPAHVAQLHALLAQSGEQQFTHPFAGSGKLAEIVDRFYTSDVFMHTWDLARATGQDETLDPDYSTALLEGMRPIEGILRQSGHYGPAMPIADDAPPHAQLMAFVGRRV